MLDRDRQMIRLASGSLWTADRSNYSPDGQGALVRVVYVGIASLILLRLQSVSLLLRDRYDR